MRVVLDLYSRFLKETKICPPVIENIGFFTALLWLSLSVAAQDGGATRSVLDRVIELNQAGQQALKQTRYADALELWKRGLELADREGHRESQSVFHGNIGVVYRSLGRYQEALSHYDKSLAIYRRIGDRRGVGNNLSNIGVLYSNLGRYQEALSHLKQALAIHREIGDRSGEGKDLSNIGVTYANVSRYQDALDHQQQALRLKQEIGDRRGEGKSLTNIGAVYYNLGRYQDALDHYQQALSIRREIGDRHGEANDLTNIGIVYYGFGRYQDALDRYQHALTIEREIGDRRGEGADLSNIGAVYSDLGRFQVALDYFQQALAVRREISDRRGEAADLSNIGGVYRDLARYQDALHHFQQALTICREIGDRRGEGVGLSNVGIVYANLGHYQDALEHYQQALAIRREIGDRRGEGVDLGNTASVYWNLGRFQDALEYYQQALVILRGIGDRRGEGKGLSSIGVVYWNLGRNQDALNQYQQALAINREINDRVGEADSLLNLGVLYGTQGDTGQALAHYHDALAIHAEFGRPESLWRLWSNLRQLWSANDEPGPAIVAGKLAVNTIQTMRAASRGLDQSLQRSFLEDKEDVYRSLADLLIAQDRPAEAQQVLDMLKESEFYDYIQGAQGHDPRATRAALNTFEADWQDSFERVAGQLKVVGDALAVLNRIKPEARTDEETARIAELEQRRDRLTTELQAGIDDLIARFDALDSEKQSELDAAMAELPDNKRALVADLSKRSATVTGLLQFVVLEDHVRSLLTTPDGWYTAATKIARDDLNDLIETLRKALTAPGTDPQPAARALYDLLVSPLSDQIEQAKVESLMVHLDGRLRYIPFAALHDGEQWLAERWPLVNYTAASERSDALHADSWRVAGLGTSKAHPGFSALPAVPGEIEGIVHHGDDDKDGVLPGVVHLDEAFTEQTLRQSAAGDYSMLHIATHFDLKPGNDSQSSLLLGTGERLSLRELREAEPALDLRHVDLVTLSACNTAMGGADSEGAEIEGMGTIIQRQGARGVLATLWPVADVSTGQLMQTLYRLRGADASLTKAEALRQAQLSLLRGSDPEQSCSAERSPVSLSGEGAEADRLLTDPGCRYAHPYYWAPFILMGNWL